MNIAVLGTGDVGKSIAGKLVQLGHQVKLGSRTANNPKAAEWIASAGNGASQGTFADAAKFGEIVFNCTSGAGTIEALKAAGEENLNGKVLIDISNPLDFSRGMPPSLFVGNTDSLGEMIQREFPSTKVVKTLNTIAHVVMVNPGMLPGEHDLFMCGNDADAKSNVESLLKNEFGWKSVVDLGDISGARAMEAWVPFWVRIMMVTGSPMHNIKVVKQN